MNGYKNKKFWIVSVTFIIVSLDYFIFYISKEKHKEFIKYALLIGGGLCEIDNYNTFYNNIEYTVNSLTQLWYDDNNVKILFYGGC
jgi:lipoprotein signal peptidase